VVAARLGLSPREADAWVKSTERDRIAFVQETFHEDPANPLHYDLVLNLSRLTLDQAADIVVETLRRLQQNCVPAGKANESVSQASPAPA
jgi:cytidylate kinase